MALTRKRALAIFKMLGEKGASAAAWADGEATEDKPYLARWLFLKALWSDVIDEDDGWMREWSNKRDPVPAAIARMLAKGIDPDDLTDVVRAMQVDLLFNVCCLLDDSSQGVEDEQAKIPENVEWRLAEYDGEREKVKRPILDIHGDFYQFDPTGRLGEPRKRAARKKRRR